MPHSKIAAACPDALKCTFGISAVDEMSSLRRLACLALFITIHTIHHYSLLMFTAVKAILHKFLIQKAPK